MNSYKTIYTNLVYSRQHLKKEWKPIGSGLERHRIVPRHQGGTYEESNCTYLTRREHIIAHWLLWKINQNVGDLNAYRYMRGIAVYPMLGKFHSEETRKKMSKAAKGKKKSEQHCLNIGKSGIGRVPQNKGKLGIFKHSEEAKHKISEAGKRQKGKVISEEARKKMSEAAKRRKRKPLSEETKRKIAESLKGKKHVIKRKWKNNN
jgi:hypothetical protein